MKNEIQDIENPQASFDKINKLNQLLSNGFIAFAMDYNHYIESVFLFKGGEKHRIYELRDSVMYRFNSAIFHLFLLLKQVKIISNRFEELLAKDPNAFRAYLNGNPHFESAQDEIMAVYDSIIFHTSSAFDYLSVLVNYNFGKQKENPLKWIQLARSCRDIENDYSKKSFAKTIDKCDREFISSFNEYRTELIHRTNSMSFASVTWEMMTGKVEAKFICSEKLTKTFKNTINKYRKNTISYLASKLIERSLLTSCEILLAIRDEFRLNYTIADNIKKGAPALGIIDPTSNTITPLGDGYWNDFEIKFNKYNESFNNP